MFRSSSFRDPWCLAPSPDLSDLVTAAAPQLAAPVVSGNVSPALVARIHRPSTAHESRQRHRDIGDRNFR